MLCYGLGIGVYLSTDRNYRRREEHGSARWGDPKGINRKYADKELTANKILTQNVAIGLDGRRHRRNLNVLVVGAAARARPGSTPSQHYERQHQPDRTGLQG